MYRSGIDTSPVGTPPREMWIWSASVRVARVEISNVCGISSASAAATRS
jgi:hypothetical protein